MKPRRPLPAWLQTAVLYQIYPQSFCDSNGDGLGDLPGIIGKLDYLRSLGATALWLNPVFDSPFGDAGYDVRDFRRVAPRYGTNADLRRLFREARRRGMRVLLDLVAGHTSAEHPWFRDSASARPGRHRDWYVWSRHWLQAFGRTDYIHGHGGRNGSFLANFFHFQPALNYGFARPTEPWHQPVTAPGPRAVKAELKRIMQFWLEAGCDGFRVDMAASLVKGDPDGSGLRRFWGGFRDWLDRDWPEAVLLAEWGHPAAAIRAGFHIDFLLHFGEPAYRHLLRPEPAPQPGKISPEPCYFRRRGGCGVTGFLENYLRHLRATAGRGYLSLPTGNHDFARLIRGRTEDELRVIYALLLTLPGVPCLFYGDEIGLRFRENLPSREGGYARTGTRCPMAWDDTVNHGFSSAAAADCYLPPDPDPGAPEVAAQSADPGSLLNLVRTLLRLRREIPALGNAAKFAPLHATDRPAPFVYERRSGRQRVIVAVNPAATPHLLTVPALRGAMPLLVRRASVAGQRLRLPGVAFGIFLCQSTASAGRRMGAKVRKRTKTRKSPGGAS
jgi:maltose alpha-D-glucosyltransferase/alpha-amylase